jgi:SNF2 family DNA or RNA helicase
MKPQTTFPVRTLEPDNFAFLDKPLQISTPSDIKPAWFQFVDLRKLVELENSANWSEMGAYKTSTGLWLLEQWVRDIKKPRMLIVTTKSGKGTYWQLVPKIHPDWEVYNVQRKKIKLLINDYEMEVDFPSQGNFPQLFITHYDVFTNRKKRKKKDEDDNLLEEILAEIDSEQPQEMLEKLLEIKWDGIILDEAHRIKNRTTGWTKNIKKLKSRHRHVMTGTGFINRPDEIWSLFHFLEPRRFTSYWRFREKFCEEEVDLTGYRRITGIKFGSEGEFKALVRSIGPRRTKPEVFPNLPHPIYTDVEVELNRTQRLMYEGIVNELYTLDQAGVPLITPSVLAALTRLRQISVATPQVVADYYDEEKERRVQEIKLIEPSSKLDALMEIIEGLEWDEERKDQIVVFSNFRDSIELAKARFEKKGISYLHLQQKDNDRTRFEKWAIEFPKKEHQVFITTLQLGSESISLTSATTCVFLDRSWSPKDNSQGVSRVWRPGQKYPANIIYINAIDTIDSRILDLNNLKQGWFNAIFG